MTKFELYELEDINLDETQALYRCAKLFAISFILSMGLLVFVDSMSRDSMVALASIMVFLFVSWLLFSVVGIYSSIVGYRIAKRNKMMGSIGQVIEHGRREAAQRSYGFRHLSQGSKS